MATLVLDPYLETWLKSRREQTRACHQDEVWDGVYVVTPPFDNEHQALKGNLHHVLVDLVGAQGKALFGGVISDRADDWTNNFRLSDACVVLNGGLARVSQTHCVGGPDFVVEIVTAGDRSYDKLDFYSHVGVRELLLVDRDPWRLELYRLWDARLQLVDKCDVGTPLALASTVIPSTFRLVPGAPRPRIEVTHRDGAQRWLI